MQNNILQEKRAAEGSYLLLLVREAVGFPKNVLHTRRDREAFAPLDA
ncbi:hypothetical protein [Methanosarcina sp. UBA5]|nr:hypothetical protein [Methanosarcina sp. UBA5]